MTPPTVTQQDRDAVGDYFEKVGDRLRAKLARCGEYDASVAVQAFARHREQARADAEDLNPDDYAEPCPKCGGSGTVEYNPEDEVEDWMEP